MANGNVEGLVGGSRRNLMVPLPEFPDLESFNARLEEQCRARQSAILHGHRETIGERLEQDLAAMSPLPASPYQARHKATGRVSSQSLVRYRTNDYSVPSTYGLRDVTIRALFCTSGNNTRRFRSSCASRQDDQANNSKPKDLRHGLPPSIEDFR